VLSVSANPETIAKAIEDVYNGKLEVRQEQLMRKYSRKFLSGSLGKVFDEVSKR